jgi:Na+/H+ antiporter NhaD/arsenite permease-like protein
MNPDMSLGQWLLLTLTVGIGGSLLSVGSAAGVALMGIGRGSYNFTSHIKWAWAILLGFIAGVATHMLLNSASFAR